MNSHELNSIMIYIHPPLAIIGYVLIFLFAILIIQKKYSEKRITKLAGFGLWLFTFLGLLTGMLWAQLAWGSYWSWDPKETMTLVLFLTASAGQVAYFEKKFNATKWLALLTCVLTILTGLSSFIIAGLHSFG
jgi:ABC-type transport system involved in cytochrome c biogenesis permease subunit